MLRLAAVLLVLSLATAATAQDVNPRIAASQGAARASEPSGPQPPQQGEVLLDAGLALPLGDLGASYGWTDRGLGAEHGYLLGLRLRFYPAARFVLSPAFNYIEFGDHDGYDLAVDPYSIQATTLRYGLDAYWLPDNGGGRVQPLLGGGVAVLRNRYREEFEGPGTTYDAHVNTLAWSLQAGVRLSDWELVCSYEVNRFTTGQLAADGAPLPYRWHALLVRVGYKLPLL